MLRLIGLVVSIGLADSLNPTTIAPALYLATGRRARGELVRFTAGVFAVYLVGGAIIALGPGQLPLALVPAPPPPRSAPGSRAILGATIPAVELPTAFPYFPAIAAIVGSGLDPVRQLVLLLLFNLFFVLPLLGMIGTLTFAGDNAQRMLSDGRRRLEAHWPAVLALLALPAGLFVTLLGVTGLAGLGHGHLGRFARRFRRLLHP